jgi:hypothetical protein
MVFIIFVFLFWFIWQSGAWSMMQLLFIVGMFIGIVLIGVIAIFLMDRPGSCNNPDVYIKDKPCTDDQSLIDKIREVLKDEN